MYHPGPEGLFWTKSAIIDRVRQDRFLGRFSRVERRFFRGAGVGRDNIPLGTSLKKMAVYYIGERSLARIASLPKNLDKRSRKIDR